MQTLFGTLFFISIIAVSYLLVRRLRKLRQPELKPIFDHGHTVAAKTDHTKYTTYLNDDPIADMRKNFDTYFPEKNGTKN